ncbi:MAG: alpha/beta hydrolase [Rhodanobacteraceae bacterium]|nr:alpha/beta hydrolase [Pseudomonadota bacterium]
MSGTTPSPINTARKQVLRAFAIASLMTLIAGCDAVLFGALNIAVEKRGYNVHRDIVFDAQHRLALDVYSPTGAKDAPVVVFFYGGRWEKGSRRQYRYAGAALAAQGVVVVVLDYRKYPQVKLDGVMTDAANAVGWTRAHAGDYGGDPNAIFLMGHSAGAHIGALLATDKSWLARVGMQPRDLAGFIGLAGPYDFTPITDTDMVGMFGDTPQQQRKSQPVDFVGGDEPPMLLLQGTGDHTVEPKNATSLANALRAQHEPVELKLYPGVSHSGILLSLSRPFRGHDPALADSIAFIRTHSTR